MFEGVSQLLFSDELKTVDNFRRATNMPGTTRHQYCG
jgi:hypothetical protein